MDKGLASLSVLVLFTVLAVLLGVGLPVIKSDAPLKAADWLGFAGNMIAAVFAAVAATVAWIAAQRQIRHAARQNSVIAYGALREVLASINSDSILTLKIGTALALIEGELSDLRKRERVNSRLVNISFELIEKNLRDLKASELELEERRANPWGGPAERAARDHLMKVIGAYAVFTETRMAIFIARVAGEIVSTELAASVVEKGDVDEEHLSTSVEAYGEFREVTDTEMKKIYALMDKHFESVTLLT